MKNRHDGIRQFFAWCEEEGEVPEGKNPMRHVRSPRVPQNPPDILREEEIRALLKACEGKTFEDRRDAALVTLLYDTGLRLSECAGITLADIDIADRREVTVIGKGRKERTLPIGANAARCSFSRRYPGVIQASDYPMRRSLPCESAGDKSDSCDLAARLARIGLPRPSERGSPDFPQPLLHVVSLTAGRPYSRGRRSFDRQDLRGLALERRT